MEPEESVVFAHTSEDDDINKFDAYKNGDSGVAVLVNNEQTQSMEKSFNWSDICRVCANTNDHIIPIFEAEGAQHDLSDKIHKYLPIQVAKTDTLPLQLCYHCAATILAWHELLEGCLDAEKQLLQMQNDQNLKEQNESKSSENFGEIPIEDPPSVQINKQESPSIGEQEEETEQGVAEGESTLRSHEMTDTRSEKLFKRATGKVVVARVTLPQGHHDEFSIANEPSAGAPKAAPKLEHSTVSCETCTRVFKGESSLKKQRVNCRVEKKAKIEGTEKIEERTAEELNSKNYCCNYCEYTARKKNLLNLHVRREHEEDARMIKKRKKDRNVDKAMADKARMEANGRVYYHCNDCGKNLLSRYTFVWHMRIHTGERPFTCHLCGKQFRVNQGLARHLRETHAGIKKFSCDICSRMFSTKRNVEDHRRIHTGERPFVCNFCGKAFKQKASLFVHNRTHTDSFQFKCHYCNQGFRTRSSLVVHLTIHTGEKPHTCDICHRDFRIKYELKRHRLIHSEEKPWRCTDCGMDFRQKRYLVNHRRSNHECRKNPTNQ